jgi:hypothetical protein
LNQKWFERDVPTFFLFGSLPGETSQIFFERGVPVLAERRQELMTDSVSPEPKVGVRGIFAPLEAVRSQPFQEFVAARFDQGPDKGQSSMPGHGKDASQAGETGPSQETEEDGFGLIIESVSCQNGG